MEALKSPKETNSVKEAKKNPKFQEEQKDKQANTTNKLKAELLRESVTDEEKDPSLMDSFTSDLSQSKNYIPREMVRMRESGNNSAANGNNFNNAKGQSRIFVDYASSNPRANSIKRGEIDSNVIN